MKVVGKSGSTQLDVNNQNTEVTSENDEGEDDLETTNIQNESDEDTADSDEDDDGDAGSEKDFNENSRPDRCASVIATIIKQDLNKLHFLDLEKDIECKAITAVKTFQNQHRLYPVSKIVS